MQPAPRAILQRSLALPLVLLAACGSELPDAFPRSEGSEGERLEGEGRVGEAGSPIIGGEPDTTHHAVVALLGKSSACTATIIAVKGSYGFALTAAHCVAQPPEVVVQGSDYQNASTSIDYPVVDWVAHPGYKESGSKLYDFAVVAFSGASAKTPVIPAMLPAEDNLGAVSKPKVVFVGYGVTETNDQNSKRMKVSGDIDVVKALTLEYDQPNGGPCLGDSGGPSLSVVSGKEVVSGVTSYGDQNCTQFGVSGRVSAVWGSFIKPVIDGTDPSQQTCEQCTQASTSGQAACADEVDACYASANCKALLACFDACGTAACDQGCIEKNPSGYGVYAKIFDCVCTDGCAEACKSAPFCQKAECGFAIQDAECGACHKSQCCEEGEACAADGACTACVTSKSPDASCASNAKVQAFYDCLEGPCGGACGGTSPTGASTSTSSGASSSTSGAGGEGGAGGSGGGGGAGGAGGEEERDEPKARPGAEEEGCGCRIAGAPAAPSSPAPLSAALAALLLSSLAARLRGRSSGRREGPEAREVPRKRTPVR